MKRFVFQLDSILRWRLTQAELEEAKLSAILVERKRLSEEIAALDRDQRAERQWVQEQGTDPAERVGLDEYLRWARRRSGQLAAALEECDLRATEQRNKVLEAHRNCDLLEKLKQKQREQWQRASDQEVEQLAAESFLARIGRAGA